MLRTHTCGELDTRSVNKKVSLCGWVHSRRDHGGVIFIDLRDRYGLTQIVFDPSNNKSAHKEAERLRREFVIKVEGVVKRRKKGMENKKLTTGAIEVFVDKLEVLNEAETPPIEIEDRVVPNDDLRLEYRYLDLRRPVMQSHIKLRHDVAQATREYLNSQNFLEIETPLLIRSTPEGARDYIVPSRVNPGKFYSLPQSPQLYKQILMVSGCDRYYQLARCLRDEDLRIDRQPEFTQVDIEMSFLEEEDIYELIEGLMKHIFKKVLNKDLKTPFKRLTYDEAIFKYGSDKPDLRFGLELHDVTKVVKDSDFSVFKNVIEHGGIVKCLNAKGCGNFSRKDLDELASHAAIYGAKGLAWAKVENNVLSSSITKYLNEKVQKEIMKIVDAKNNDLILFVADKPKVVHEALGQLRLFIAKRLNLANPDEFNFCWVTDFPLFEWSEDEEKYVPMHHIFSMPKFEDMNYLESDPSKVKGQLYDLTLNGVEVAGGSIRIHKREIQERVLKVIGMDYAQAERNFGFLLKAFKFGAPPHGGIAVGFDRLVSLLSGSNDIRDFIAFPKNKAAQCPMDGSPSEVDESILKDVHIKLDVVRKK
ncbi:MAG: aspartate--tRNA ligase [Candidatus Nanoarchaeia archaeon]